MKPNSVLEEIWRAKDELAREAGYDIHRLCENTRKWALEHPHPGPVIRSPEELRRYLTEKEAARAVAAAPMLLNDKPSGKI